MGGHRRHGRWPRRGFSEESPSRWTGASLEGRPAPRTLKPVSWIVAITGLAVWTLVAWIAYALVDPVLGWVAGSAGVLVDGGKDLATAAGAGKDVGAVIDNLNASGLLGQAIALFRVVIKPTIVVLWAIGVLVVLAAPVFLPRIGRLLGGRRH
jgi:hypothetical protein